MWQKTTLPALIELADNAEDHGEHSEREVIGGCIAKVVEVSTGWLTIGWSKRSEYYRL